MPKQVLVAIPRCADTDRPYCPRPQHALQRAAVLLAALIASVAAHAEVYKWTDEKGQIHFSDKPPPSSDRSAQQSVAQIKLGSAGPSFNVRRLSPALDSAGASRMPLRLAGLSQTILPAGRTDLTPGQIFTGPGCREASPLVLSASEVDFGNGAFSSIVLGAFSDAGWNVEGADGSSAGMDLMGEVSNLRVDQCAPGGAAGNANFGARAYVRLRWVLSGPNGEILYRGGSEGAHDGWNTGTEYTIAIQQALSMAANNLLADTSLVEKVREQRLSGTAVSASGASTEAKVRWGDASGVFAQRSAEIQGAVLLVQTGQRSGSGVVIDLNGWALTSARLVGNEANVMVVAGKVSLPAAVVKRDELSDVALLRFVRNDFKSILVAPHAVLPGDPVHVISAPGSVGAANTVTGTDLIGEESIAGKPRFQLGVTEKYSNPGAPVFNRYGELAGLISMDPVHAGSGVEGLRMVPILQALHAAGVDLR